MSEGGDSEHQPVSPRRRLARRAASFMLRVVLWASLAIVVGVAAFIFTPFGDWAYGRLVICDPLDKSDAIIVLGGGYERVVEASHLYRQRWSPKVILTSLPADVADMRQIAVEYGIPPDALVDEPAARRTSCHPRTVELLGVLDKSSARVIVITSPGHTSRAKACFVRAGYKNVIVRYPMWMADRSFRPNWFTRATRLPFVVYETAAWGLYKLRGWV